jgi:hypothetical protein
MAIGELALGNLEFADNPIALVAKNGLDEADLERCPEVEDAETAVGLAAARIAEPCGILPVAERIGIGLAVDAAERSANVDRRNDQIDASKISGRRRTRH